MSYYRFRSNLGIIQFWHFPYNFVSLSFIIIVIFFKRILLLELKDYSNCFDRWEWRRFKLWWCSCLFWWISLEVRQRFPLWPSFHNCFSVWRARKMGNKLKHDTWHFLLTLLRVVYVRKQAKMKLYGKLWFYVWLYSDLARYTVFLSH